MSMPSPFEMGRAIGGNISGGIRGGIENNQIDQILQQAQASGDPAQVQNVMNQIITRVSPEKRPVVMQALQNRQQQLVDQKTQTEMVKVADQLEANYPDSPAHKMIANVYRSNIPIAEKEKITKAISGSIPYKFQQQARLHQDSIIKNYNTLIKETEAELKNIWASGNIKRKKELQDRKTRLQKERDAILDFDALKDKEEKKEETNESGKTVFNPEIPSHKKEAQDLFKKYKSKEKVAKELSKKYEL